MIAQFRVLALVVIWKHKLDSIFTTSSDPETLINYFYYQTLSPRLFIYFVATERKYFHQLLTEVLLSYQQNGLGTRFKKISPFKPLTALNLIRNKDTLACEVYGCSRKWTHQRHAVPISRLTNPWTVWESQLFSTRVSCQSFWKVLTSSYLYTYVYQHKYQQKHSHKYYALWNIAPHEVAIEEKCIQSAI